MFKMVRKNDSNDSKDKYLENGPKYQLRGKAGSIWRWDLFANDDTFFENENNALATVGSSQQSVIAFVALRFFLS